MCTAPLFRTAAFLAVCALTLSLTACDTAAPVADGATANAAQKSDVCHATGSEDNPYVLITVADAALPAHVAHGDASPGEAVPGMDGFVFDDACVPVEACPCFTSADLLSVTADNNRSFDSCGSETRASVLPPNGAIIQNELGSVPGVEGGFAASLTFNGSPECFTRDQAPFVLPITAAEVNACAQLILDRCDAIGDPVPASGGTTQSGSSDEGASLFGN